MVKTLSFHRMGPRLNPWLGSRDPTWLTVKKKKNEIENRNNIVINSIKTLKMVYIQKKSLKKYKYSWLRRFLRNPTASANSWLCQGEVWIPSWDHDMLPPKMPLSRQKYLKPKGFGKRQVQEGLTDLGRRPGGIQPNRPCIVSTATTLRSLP